MIQRRAMLAGLAVGLAACSPAPAQDAGPRTVGAGLTVREGDYAADRAAFRTRLLYHVPSPQRFPPSPAPTGVEEIAYPSGELRLRAWAKASNSGPTRKPAVIFLHGGFAFGPEDFDTARAFLNAGFTIFTPLLRGENGLPGDFSMFYDEVADVLAMADAVKARPDVDPARIFLAGHSVGGTMAMLAGMASDVFRAVASFSGSPDQIAFCGAQPWTGIVPFDRENPREFEMRSPLAYPGSFKSPTRLYFGSQEGFFAGSTPLLATLAKAAGRNVEAQQVIGDHYSALPEEIVRAISFFNAQS